MTTRLSTGLQNILAGRATEMLAAAGADPTMASVAWLTASNATLTSETGGQAGNRLQVAETGSSNPGKAYYDITTKIGHLYRFQVYFKKGTADNGKVFIGTTSVENSLYDSGALTDADWALKTAYFVASAVTTRITFQSTDATAGEYSSFDTPSLVCMDGSLRQAFYGGDIKIYSGTQPSDPDDAPTGTLLVTIKNAGNGITFGEAVDGVLSKTVGETWTGIGVADGTAGWFRLCAPGDLGTDNEVDARLDGAVATSGGQLNFGSLAFALGATQTVPDLHPTVKISA